MLDRAHRKSFGKGRRILTVDWSKPGAAIIMKALLLMQQNFEQQLQEFKELSNQMCTYLVVYFYYYYHKCSI